MSLKHVVGRLSRSLSPPPVVAPPPMELADEWRLPAERRPVFALGTGRCGTHFLQRAMEGDPAIDSHHIQLPDADSFTRYCQWNELPVDIDGFMAARKAWAVQASREGRLYFESNPYLAFSVAPLAAQMEARFIFVIRRPEDVVSSHHVKGWYEGAVHQAEADLALGFQPLMRANHFFGRITPRGAELRRWQGLTRTGKISWMWSAVNLRIWEQLQEQPPESWRLVKLEELDHRAYLDLHTFVGGAQARSEGAFADLRRKRPGKGPRRRTIDEWSQLERDEFLAETESARETFDYSAAWA